MKKDILLIKNNKFQKIKKISLKKLKGFSFKPKNKSLKNGVQVNKLVIINPSFTETILKKKIKNRLELYLRFIISLLDEEDDTDITDLRAALNDLTRYRQIIEKKYLLYLDKKYAEMLLKKIDMLEEELKMKIVNFQPKEKEDEIRRSR